MEVWVSNNRLTTPLVIEESVPSQERERSCIYFASFCDCSTVFWNCADSVVFFGFQFIKQAMELLLFVFFRKNLM
jgi:hypothetical protein